MHRSSSIASSAPARLVLIVALALGGVACDSGPSEPDTPAVATVVVSGAPTGALHVAATAQLAATTLSSTGSVINGATVNWRSSNEAAATVSSGGLVTARAAGHATVTASSGSGNATVEIRVVAPLTLDQSTTTIALPDGSLSLTVTGGAVFGTATYLVGPDDATLADELVVPGTIFQIAAAPGTTQQSFAGLLTLRYDGARLPAAAAAHGLQLHKRVGTGWSHIRGSESNVARSVVTGSFAGPGTYAVRFTPVSRVVLSGAQLDGALVVGQIADLNAAAVSVFGDTLPLRAVTWASSAPGVAAVDVHGTVTGVSAGTATLTATSDGVSETTQVRVLARPVASWPAGVHWTTHRGDNRRTGYVDATLDPTVFTRRWEVAIAPNGWLNEPATGDGNVYVSHNAEGLWALDPATGAVRWTHDFGEVLLGGPATGNGRVYVATGGHEDSFLWSFDAATGAERFRSAYGNQWSRWRAPAVTASAVFAGSGYYGGISAFEAMGGAELWHRPLPQQADWAPAVDAGRAYAFGWDGDEHGLLTFEGQTGAATLDVPHADLPLAATPVLGGANDLYVLRGGRLMALDLAHAMVAWSVQAEQFQGDGAPAIDGVHLYPVVDGRVEARRRHDGSLAWSWTPSGGEAIGSAIVTRNLLFVRIVPNQSPSSGGRVVALDLASRRVVWDHAGGGEIALGDGLLLITSRTGARLTAISVR